MNHKTADILHNIDEHLAVVHSLRETHEVIARCAQLIIDAFEAGGRLYVFGNGGSAADSQHIAAELVGRFKRSDKPALPATALTTDTSNLTAIGNDFGFDNIFVRQIDALVRPGDVVWALSVSGRSPNVLEALARAREIGAQIICFTGRHGSALNDGSTVCLVADHEVSDRVQEVHQLAYHVVCGLIEDHYCTT